MSYQNTIFSQFLSIIPKHRFEYWVKQHQSDKWSKKCTTWNQFVCLAYAQIRERGSLREIEEGLETQSKKLTHLGVQSIKRSTLSDINSTRSSSVFESIYYDLLKSFQNNKRGNQSFMDKDIKIIDSSRINLCASLFPWAKMQKQKGGFKLHCLLNHKDWMPEFVDITDGLKNDIEIGKQINIKPDSIYLFDKGYYDFSWFNTIHSQKAFFVTRLKTCTKLTDLGQLSEPKLSEGIVRDTRVRFCSRSARKYPHDLRLVVFKHPQTMQVFHFITNRFDLTPSTIAELYKQRWQIELFFKWIKQNLKIKSFIGTSKNAVCTQIWIALIVYLMLHYLKRQTQSRSLTQLSRVLFETLFDRISLIHILSKSPSSSLFPNHTPLPLFNSA